jgi:hypothetical protein
MSVARAQTWREGQILLQQAKRDVAFNNPLLRGSFLLVFQLVDRSLNNAQCHATGSAHDHSPETKIMLVHLRFITTLPLRFLPPLHINSPPAPTRWACIRFLRFSISDFAPADGLLRCSRKGTSARPLSSSSYAVFNIVVWRIPGIKAGKGPTVTPLLQLRQQDPGYSAGPRLFRNVQIQRRIIELQQKMAPKKRKFYVRSWRRWVRRDWSRLNLRMRGRTPAFRASNKRRSTSQQYTDDLLIRGTR